MAEENPKPEIHESKDNQQNDDDDSKNQLSLNLSEYLSGRHPSVERYPGAERLQYDYVGERQNQNTHSTTILESTSHLVKSCLGASILIIHVGFKDGGLWTSLVASLGIGIVVTYTMLLVVSCAQRLYSRLRVPKLSYPDLAEAATLASGPWPFCRPASKMFRYFVDICLFIDLCGTCCVYQIMMANTMRKVLSSLYPSSELVHGDVRIFILLTLPLLLIFSLIRTLKFLAPFSLIADICIGFSVVATIYYGIADAPMISERPAWRSLSGFFKFCGICIFSIKGVSMALPIENHMKRPKYITVVIQLGMSIVVISLSLVGFFGFLGWGDVCRSPITVHLPSDTFPLILQILTGLMLSITLALQFWVPFRSIWYYLSTFHRRKSTIWERFYRALFMCVLTAFSTACPNVDTMMSFIGDFFLAFLSFIFPAFIDTLILWKDPYETKGWFLFRNICIMMCGSVMCGGAFYIHIV